MMKNSILLSGFCLLVTGVAAQVDWSPTTKHGIITITGTPQAAYDIDILRDHTDAGLRTFNTRASGRSLVLLGQGNGGKYGYLSHHGDTHNAGTNYTEAYKSSSTSLTGADINGLTLASAQNIRFFSGGTENNKLRMTLDAAGNLNLLQNLWVNNGGTVSTDMADNDPAYSWSSTFSVRNNNNTNGTYSRLSFVSESGGFGAISVRKTGTFTGDMYLQVRNGPGFYLTPVIIKAGGNVGIGSMNPNEKLTVNGTIYGKEVKVDLNVPGPDYVFENDYDLLSLNELETYVNKHKHLPDVPSAEEMKTNGIYLQEMNMLLLKKVEELTLHLIEMDKKDREQQKFNAMLIQEIEQLKNKPAKQNK